MSEIQFIALYAAGICCVVLFSAIRIASYAKTGKKLSGKFLSVRPVAFDELVDVELPGKIFRFMIFLGDCLPYNDPNESKGVYLQMRYTLGDIAKNARRHLERQFGIVLNISDEKVRIIQNIAICLRSFLIQTRKDYDIEMYNNQLFINGLTDLMHLINRLNRQKISHKYLDEVVACKQKIYYSFFGGQVPDEQLTLRFKQDFFAGIVNIDFRNKGSLELFLKNLEDNWIDHNRKLAHIDNIYIIALFSAYNILRSFKDRDISEGIEQLQELHQYILNKDIRSICHLGIKFNRQPRDTLQPSNKDLPED